MKLLMEILFKLEQDKRTWKAANGRADLPKKIDHLKENWLEMRKIIRVEKSPLCEDVVCPEGKIFSLLEARKSDNNECIRI